MRGRLQADISAARESMTTKCSSLLDPREFSSVSSSEKLSSCKIDFDADKSTHEKFSSIFTKLPSLPLSFNRPNMVADFEASRKNRLSVSGLVVLLMSTSIATALIATSREEMEPVVHVHSWLVGIVSCHLRAVTQKVDDFSGRRLPLAKFRASSSAGGSK